MDYVYIGVFSIIDTIKFKKYILSNNDDDSNKIVNEIIKHLNIYTKTYTLSNNLLLDDLNAVEIEKEIYVCEPSTVIENKKRLLIYIIFLTNTKFTIQENEIDAEKGNIVIFPSEWFFNFKLNKSKLIVGNIYEFKE
jgi:hypothetical protein